MNNRLGLKWMVVTLNNAIPMRLRVMRRQLMMRPKIKKWLCEMKEKDLDDSEREVIAFLEKSPFNHFMFPYPFIKKYDASHLTVYFDKTLKLPFVMLEGKRLYYPASWQPYSIKAMHNHLLVEQDLDSPHRYEKEGGGVREGDVVVDAGAAEGFFALSVVERARRVVLVEASPEWLPPLRATFAPFLKKVVFVQKLITGKSGNNHITLDEIMQMEGRIDFIKADIEGYEEEMLKGGEETLSQSNLRLAVAVYHYVNDVQLISDFLKRKNFTVSLSQKWILMEDFENGKLRLRRGICYAEKNG